LYINIIVEWNVVPLTQLRVSELQFPYLVMKFLQIIENIFIE